MPHICIMTLDNAHLKKGETFGGDHQKKKNLKLDYPILKDSINNSL